MPEKSATEIKFVRVPSTAEPMAPTQRHRYRLHSSNNLKFFKDFKQKREVKLCILLNNMANFAVVRFCSILNDWLAIVIRRKTKLVIKPFEVTSAKSSLHPEIHFLFQGHPTTSFGKSLFGGVSVRLRFSAASIKECTRIFITETHNREIIAPGVFGRVIFATFGSQNRQLAFSESKNISRKFVESSI